MNSHGCCAAWRNGGGVPADEATTIGRYNIRQRSAQSFFGQGQKIALALEQQGQLDPLEPCVHRQVDWSILRECRWKYSADQGEDNVRVGIRFRLIN